MSQVFNLKNGHFAYVAASGISASGMVRPAVFTAPSAAALGWITANNPASALDLLYFEGLNVTSGRTINTIMNRGVPDHHKLVSLAPLRLQFSYLYTGGDGIPTNLLHLQWHAIEADFGAASAYQYFTHAIVENQDFNERAESDMRNVTMLALQMFGHNAALL